VGFKLILLSMRVLVALLLVAVVALAASSNPVPDDHYFANDDVDLQTEPQLLQSRSTWFRRTARSWGRRFRRAWTNTKKTAHRIKRKIAKKFQHKPHYFARKMKVEDVRAGFPLPIAGSTFPQALQGLFWLQDQGSKSSLVTFASSPSAKTQRSVLSGKQIDMEVDGDRTWSFSDSGLLKTFDRLDRVGKKHLVYRMEFNSNSNPTYAHILPRGLGAKLNVAEWLSDFDMYLLKDHKYNGSVVWQRNTTALFGKFNVKPGTYKMVQVMDGTGKKLPAWKQWLKFMYSPKAGKSPGYLWYRTSETAAQEKARHTKDKKARWMAKARRAAKRASTLRSVTKHLSTRAKKARWLAKARRAAKKAKALQEIKKRLQAAKAKANREQEHHHDDHDSHEDSHDEHEDDDHHDDDHDEDEHHHDDEHDSEDHEDDHH